MGRGQTRSRKGDEENWLHLDSLRRLFCVSPCKKGQRFVDLALHLRMFALCSGPQWPQFAKVFYFEGRQRRRIYQVPLPVLQCGTLLRGLSITRQFEERLTKGKDRHRKGKQHETTITQYEKDMLPGGSRPEYCLSNAERDKPGRSAKTRRNGRTSSFMPRC